MDGRTLRCAFSSRSSLSCCSRALSLSPPPSPSKSAALCNSLSYLGEGGRPRRVHKPSYLCSYPSWLSSYPSYLLFSLAHFPKGHNALDSAKLPVKVIKGFICTYINEIFTWCKISVFSYFCWLAVQNKVLNQQK